MTKREIISLFIKLMGVYALVQLVPVIVSAMALLGTSLLQLKEQPLTTLSAGFLMLIIPLLWIVLCLRLIGKSDWLAERLYPVDAPAGQLTTLGVQDIQRLGYHFIGLLLVVKSLPTLIMALYQFLILSGQPYEHRYQALSMYSHQWISQALQLAIGLYLFLRPKGLANLWARMQGKVPDYVCSEPQENKKE